MDYDTLVNDKTTDGSIKSWVNDSTVPSAEILTEAEAEIYQRLRVRQMRALGSDTTIALGDSTYALPSDYLASFKFRITGDEVSEIKRHSQERVLDARLYDSSGNLHTGKPSMFYTAGTTAYFEHKADQAYTCELWYFQVPTALSSGNPTNFLTDRYPRLLRHACLMLAYEFKKDDRRQQFYARSVNAAIDAANLADGYEQNYGLADRFIVE